jgi:hypothetical protein
MVLGSAFRIMAAAMDYLRVRTKKRLVRSTIIILKARPASEQKIPDTRRPAKKCKMPEQKCKKAEQKM